MILTKHMTRVKNFFKNNFFLVILFILIIPTFRPLVRPGYFPMHDDMQAMRLLQLDKCVKDAQIPCRWVPDMGYGYGYPQFNYYAPLPYYIMEAFHLSGFGFLDSVKIGFILSIIVSAIGMYFLWSSLWGKTGGFVSAFLYSYAPYKAVDIYVRGAMGEAWAFAILPFVFWSAFYLIEGKKKSLMWFALSFSALFTSHNISSFITLPFLAVWILFLLFIKSKDSPFEFKRFGLKIFLGLAWGFSLSAFFLLPAWFEKNLVHIETLLGGYFNYINHFVGLKQLLFETQWGYGTSEVGPYDDLLLSVGLVHWILPLISVALFIFLKKKRESRLILSLAVMGWLGLFMTHPRSAFFWEEIFALSYIQFPWRFLLFSTFFFAIASGSLVLLFKKRSKLGKLWLFFFVILIFFLYRNYFTPRVWINESDQEKFSGESWQRQQTISIFDYLPVYAGKPPGQPAPDTPSILAGEVNILDGEKGTDWQKWNMEVGSDNAEVQLPLFYFPGWKVMINGRQLPVRYDNSLGLITFEIYKGQQLVEARLFNTPIRAVSNILTLMGLILIPIYLRKSIKLNL